MILGRFGGDSGTVQPRGTHMGPYGDQLDDSGGHSGAVLGRFWDGPRENVKIMRCF